MRSSFWLKFRCYAKLSFSLQQPNAISSCTREMLARMKVIDKVRTCLCKLVLSLQILREDSESTVKMHVTLEDDIYNECTH